MEVKKTSCGGFSFFKTSVLHSFIPAHLSPMNIDARACRFQISNNPLLLTYFAALYDRTHMQTQTSAHACTTGYVNNKDCIWNVKNTENTCMQKCLDSDRAVLLQYRHNMPLTIYGLLTKNIKSGQVETP